MVFGDSTHSSQPLWMSHLIRNGFLTEFLQSNFGIYSNPPSKTIPETSIKQLLLRPLSLNGKNRPAGWAKEELS